MTNIAHGLLVLWRQFHVQDLKLEILISGSAHQCALNTKTVLTALLDFERNFSIDGTHLQGSYPNDCTENSSACESARLGNHEFPSSDFQFETTKVLYS